MTLIEGIGYFNAALGVAMLAMQTMIPLRITGIAHNIVSIFFGYSYGVFPMLVQHAILLPINSLRLYEMINLIRKIKVANKDDSSLDWIKPFTNKQEHKAGDILFRKDDRANSMYFLVSGKLRLREIDMMLDSGAVVGELGFLAPDKCRTQTIECVEDSVLLTIGYDRLEQLYFQNPKFGMYFLRLTTARLFDNIRRMEDGIAQRDRQIATLMNRLAAAERVS